jgi:WD40 repeat protein
MGMVYLAEQQKPVRRRVALKVIKLGMDTKEVIARFESERQALALMSHANIARIFDAGSTEEGRPYFAMEYVPGETITEYCDKHRLSIRERLALFIEICRAIHHAHQKAIIHRDVKPSNILVMIEDDRPVPKVIDFGVAKATTQHLTERTVFTEFGELVGTPEYMSPEQLEMTGLDVDTTTDVYSLGVLLYELLVGALPFDPKTLREAGWDGLRRLIREVDPPRPSTRITEAGERAAEVAARRHTEIDTLRKLVHGELDWITMRALEKDRTRRYQSASELAADVERYLTDEPVQASPPSTAYRFRKFVRRHRVPVAAAGAIAAAIIVLGSIAFWQGRIAQRRAIEAQANAVLAYATATDDAVLKALLVLELADLPETPEALAVAREAADHPLPVAVLQGHEEMLYHIGFSPDGTRVVTASMDGTARIWSVDGTGQPVVLSGHNNEVYAAEFSPDGERVATVSADSTGRVWSADGSGGPVVLRHPESVEGCEFSPDGTRLLIGCFDGAARIWNADGTGEPLVFRHGDNWDLYATFSPDGRQVATTWYGDSTLQIWSADGRGEPVGIQISAWHSYFPSFSPDGTLVTIAVGDSTACIWRTDGSGAPTVLRHPMGVEFSLFSPDGSRILTADDRGVLRIWDAGGTGQPLVLWGHEQALDSVCFSPDGSLILTGSVDGTARLWRADGSGEPLVLWRHSAEMYDVTFSPDGTLVAIACADGTARVYRTGDTGEQVVLQAPQVWCADISPDGTQVITGGWDDVVRVLHARGRAEPLVLGTHRGYVSRVRFSPDGMHAITASGDSTVRIWRIDGSEEPIILRGHGGGASSAQFSPDGSHVLTASRSGRVLLRPANGEGDARTLCELGGYAFAEFSPDGTRVLTVSSDGAQLWPTDGAGNPVLVADQSNLTGKCRFSPDGTQVLTAHVWGDNTVRMWSADGTGEPVEFRGHSGWVRGGVGFSPDGSRIVSAAGDWTARVWPVDGATEPLVIQLRGHPYATMFTPDGSSILTAAAGEIRIQRVTWPSLIEYLRENTHASLTPEQRMKYLAETPSQAWAAYEESERRQGRTPTLKRPD